METVSIVVEIGAFAQLWNAVIIKEKANKNPVVTIKIHNIFVRLLLVAICDKPWIVEVSRNNFMFVIGAVFPSSNGCC